MNLNLCKAMEHKIPEMPEGVAAFVRDVSEKADIRRILLFGSRARRDAAERSDYDIAIEAPEMSEDAWIKIEHMAEDAQTLYKIDCLRYETAPEDLKRNILKDGIVLYERAN